MVSMRLAQPCRVNRDKGCAGSGCGFPDACKLLRSRTEQPRGVARHVKKGLFTGAGCRKHGSASMHAPSAAFTMQQGMRHGVRFSATAGDRCTVQS